MAYPPVILMKHGYQSVAAGNSPASCVCGKVLQEDFLALLEVSVGGGWQITVLSME